MNTEQLTDWIENEDPVRVGDYDRLYLLSSPTIVREHWDGTWWLDADGNPCMLQNTAWRGLARDPEDCSDLFA